MPDRLLAEKSHKEEDNLYNVLGRVIQESNRNIKKLDETINVLAAGQEKLSAALLRIEERHAADLTRIEEKHEENRERFSQQEANYHEQARNLLALEEVTRNDISDIKMKQIGYDKDFEIIKVKAANHTKVLSGVSVSLISALILAFILNK